MAISTLTSMMMEAEHSTAARRNPSTGTRMLLLQTERIYKTTGLLFIKQPFVYLQANDQFLFCLIGIDL